MAENLELMVFEWVRDGGCWVFMHSRPIKEFHKTAKQVKILSGTHKGETYDLATGEATRRRHWTSHYKYSIRFVKENS